MNRDAFAAWLEALPPRTFVGTREHCPLAVYLRETGYPEARVGFARYSLVPTRMLDEANPLDPWMIEFIDWADNQEPLNKGWDCLTAAAAREALARIPA